MAKARMSSLFTEPLDFTYGAQHWDDLEDEEPAPNRALRVPDSSEVHLNSPGFDPSYPFSPQDPGTGHTPFAWDRVSPQKDGEVISPGDSRFSPPPASKKPRSVNKSARLSRRGSYQLPPTTHITSPESSVHPNPLSPRFLAETRTQRQSEAMRHNSIPHPTSLTVGGGRVRRGEGSTIPETLAVPDFTDYDHLRSEAFERLGEDGEEVPPTPTTSTTRRASHGGLARRLTSRLMGTVKRKRTSSGENRWGGSSQTHTQLDGEAGGGGDREYMELRGVEERDEPIGFDVSSFGPEFAVPSVVAKVMDKHRFDENMAYTGAGDAIDLTNLTGLGEVDKDSDSFSLDRMGTGFEDKQSFFFTPGRHIPNWKPPVLKTWYITMLVIFSLVMIGGMEALYQASDKHLIRKGSGRDGGGLFAYKSINDLSTVQFAIWKYLPTLVGVLYGIMWKVTDEELKRTEPYYQLSKGSTGALAAESLNIEYDTIWSPMVPVAALKYGQFVVAAGSIASFIASSLIPIFLSVVIRVDPSQNERQRLPDNGANDWKRLIVDVVWTRLLQVTLGIIVILGTYVTAKLHLRRSGLLGDPSGIAGVAAMANKSHILMDFRDLDLATESQIHKQLNKRTYILHKGALWQAQRLREHERDNSAPKAMNPHPLLLRFKGMGPFLAFCLGMLVLLPLAVFNTNANVIIDETPWIITGISVLIKSVWELLEKEMRMLEPFWILFNRNAPSSVLTLDYSATIPGYIVIKALSKGHLLLAWVTSISILIEILTVVMGSLDTQGGEESPLSSSVSFILCIVILSLVLLTGFLVLHKRRHPFLPRQPGTISSVLAFIHQSRMLTDFGGTEQQSTEERRRKLEKLGMKYGFGWYLGRDGKRHLGIDFEPLLGGFKVGRDPRRAVVDELVGWEVYGEG